MESFPQANNPDVPVAPEVVTDPREQYLAELANEWGVESLQPIADSDIALLHTSFGKASETGNRDDLDMLIGDLAESFARQNPVFVQNVLTIRSIIRNKDKENQIRAQQTKLFDQAKQAVLMQAQLPEELSKDEYQTAKENIHRRLAAANIEHGETHDKLTMLGMLKKDEDGHEIYSWPEPGTFPKSTDEKWQTYLGAVKAHKLAVLQFNSGTGTVNQQMVEEADTFRRHTHNIVSRDVSDLLAFGGDAEEARRLVAKMRDNRFPSTDTSEKERTNYAIGQNIMDVGDTVTNAMRRDLYTRAYGDDPMVFDPENGNSRSFI